MSNKTPAIIMALCFLTGTYGLFAEKQVALTLINTNSLYHDYSVDSLGYPGDFSVHATVNPSFNFEDSFQSDALLDVYVTKDYFSSSSTNQAPTFNLKQAFIDLLFYDIIRLKAGFNQLSFGYNNCYYNPLDVSTFIPEFRQSYPEIIVGASNLGRPGIPSAVLSFIFPEMVSGLSLSLSQSIIWTAANDFSKVNYFSVLKGGYAPIQIELIASYNGKTFSNWEGTNAPVFAANTSITLPFSCFFLWEGVLTQNRSQVDFSTAPNVGLTSGPFFNQVFRFETSQVEPLFNNKLDIFAEYFYYDQGLEINQYESLVGLLPSAYQVIPERNFKNNLTMGISYNTQTKWQFAYKAIAEIDSAYWQHWVTIGKQFNAVNIGGTLILCSKVAQALVTNFNSRDVLFYFQVSIDM